MPDDIHNDSEVNADEKVTIKIPKGNGKSDTAIKGSINGMAYEVAVDQEVEVPSAVAQAIGDTGIAYEVVDGEGAGLPSSSAALTDTATRLTPAVAPEDAVAGGNGDRPIPTLEGGQGDTGHGAGSAEPTAESPENIDASRNAEGQGVAASGGSDNAQGGTSGENPSGETAGGDKGSDADEQEGDKETVADLKKRLATINDVDALKREHDAEEQGAKRTTALAAIHARIDEVQEKA